ncbi:MAG: hypothetical protein JWP74_3303 [Marmoricola sp.]|nr:hypothetical protein [Marmoricola sp.]
MNHTSLRTVTAAACAVLATVALAGCGSAGPAKALTQAQFKAQANALCKAGDADIKKIGATLTPTATNDQVVAALTKAADRDDQTVAAIRKLKAPAAIAGDVTALLDAVNTATQTIRTEGVKVTATGTPSPFTDADAKAKALGLDECASSSGT